jgi:hypothetical protein
MKEAELGAAAIIANDSSKCLKALTEDLVPRLQTRQFVKLAIPAAKRDNIASTRKLTTATN